MTKHTFNFTNRKTGEVVKQDAQYGREHAAVMALSQLGIDITEHRIFGVSFGDGNNGVFQLFPVYYVWTDDPYNLARLATIGQFTSEGMGWAAEEVEVDGEAENTVSATILNPPDDDPDGSNHYECGCGQEWTEKGKENEMGECPACAAQVSGVFEPDDDGDWCSANGAWMIVEVFPVDEDDVRDGMTVYESLEEAFNEEIRQYMEG